MARHQPYKDTPPQPRKPIIVSARDKAVFAQHQAIDYLRGHIGGRWRWDPEQQLLQAEFDSRIADAIRSFMEPLGVHCHSADARNSEKTLSLSKQDFSTLQQKAHFVKGDRALADQYRDMMAMNRPLHR